MQLTTHNGTFHLDDLFSTVILKTLHPDSTLVRTRDESQMRGIVYDVGCKYDHTNKVYDHHFDGKPLRPNNVPYSGVGLIWKHYGVDYLLACGINPSHWKKIDVDLIQNIDALDNGYTKGIDTRNVHTLVTYCQYCNPLWNESADNFDATYKALLPLFKQYATTLDKSVWNQLSPLLAIRKHDYEKSVDSARAIILPKINPASDVLELDCPMPWQEIINNDNAPQLNYVVWPSDIWRCQTVPTTPNGFTPKVPLPKAWRGKLNFAQVSGIPDAVFCHPAGFIMGAKSRDSIYTLIDKAKVPSQHPII